MKRNCIIDNLNVRNKIIRSYFDEILIFEKRGREPLICGRVCAFVVLRSVRGRRVARLGWFT